MPFRDRKQRCRNVASPTGRTTVGSGAWVAARRIAIKPVGRIVVQPTDAGVVGAVGRRIRVVVRRIGHRSSTMVAGTAVNAKVAIEAANQLGVRRIGTHAANKNQGKQEQERANKDRHFALPKKKL